MTLLQFETRVERGERTYRDIVAGGQAELEHRASCRACGFRDPERVLPTKPDTTAAPAVELPQRTDEERAARLVALEPTAARLAAAVRRALPAALPESTFDLWIAPLVLTDSAADVLFVAAPPPAAAWTADRYGRLLDQAATTLAGKAVRVELYPADVPAGARTLGDLTINEGEDAGAQDDV